MIRVAQVVTRFIAGAGGVALRGMLALPRAEYCVTVYCAPGGPLAGIAADAGIEVVTLDHMSPHIAPRDDWRGLRELTAHLSGGRFDIVHTHSTKAGALGRMAARRAGVPAVVHTFHGFPFHDFQPAPLNWAYIAAERQLGRLTNRFLAVGSAVAAKAVDLRIAPPERITTIASAVAAEARVSTPQDRASARRRLELPADARVVGSVGRLDRQKAPLDMLRAFAPLAEQGAYFVWIGDGPLRPAVEAAVRRAGLGERFRLLGERDDVLELLPGMDVFALSSLYEGLPCALVEAISRSVPVVATAVNAVPEVVLPGRSGLLVPPAAPDLLGRAMAHLLNHPAEAARMAAEARAIIGDRFSVSRLGRDLEATYQLALNADEPLYGRLATTSQGLMAPL